MAAAEAPESRHALRALRRGSGQAACLFGVLLAARAVTLATQDLPLSLWSPFAFLWQDVLTALIFYAAGARLRGAVA